MRLEAIRASCWIVGQGFRILSLVKGWWESECVHSFTVRWGKGKEVVRLIRHQSATSGPWESPIVLLSYYTLLFSFCRSPNSLIAQNAPGPWQ